MVYAHSRKIAEFYSMKLAERVGALGILDKDGLRRDAEMIRAEGKGLEMAERLAQCIEKAVAFHHAGLMYSHRRIVEESFSSRRLKVVCATPTLAAGINLPARMVIIPEVKKSVKEMSVMEYKQLAGRAGRPGYDNEGYAVIIASNKRRLNAYTKKYLMGRLEPVKSQLTGRKLTWAILASASAGIVEDEEDLEDFMRSTLLNIQGGYTRVDVYDALASLRRIGLIKQDSLELTRLGRGVAELCVDPLTAIIAKRLATMVIDDVALIAISCCPDLSPI